MQFPTKWLMAGLYNRNTAWKWPASQVNTLRPRQNGRHFPDDIFQCIFLIENVWIWIKISLKFVPKVRINNIPALVQIMAWRRGDKPLSEPMMVNLLTHICITRPQWVKGHRPKNFAKCPPGLCLSPNWHKKRHTEFLIPIWIRWLSINTVIKGLHANLAYNPWA